MPALIVRSDKVAQRMYKYLSESIRYAEIEVYDINGKLVLWFSAAYTPQYMKASATISGNVITITLSAIYDGAESFTIGSIKAMREITIKLDQPISKDVTEILKIEFTLTVGVG